MHIDERDQYVSTQCAHKLVGGACGAMAFGVKLTDGKCRCSRINGYEKGACYCCEHNVEVFASSKKDELILPFTNEGCIFFRGCTVPHTTVEPFVPPPSRGEQGFPVWEALGKPAFWSLALQGRCPWAPKAMVLAWGKHRR